jgi:hypothetical protein
LTQWTLDQAIGAVDQSRTETVVTIEDRGFVPMPVHIVVTRADGTWQRPELAVDAWLVGARQQTLRIAMRRESRVLKSIRA